VIRGRGGRRRAMKHNTDAMERSCAVAQGIYTNTAIRGPTGDGGGTVAPRGQRGNGQRQGRRPSQDASGNGGGGHYRYIKRGTAKNRKAPCR
jgi:hypothetical protein